MSHPRLYLSDSSHRRSRNLERPRSDYSSSAMFRPNHVGPKSSRWFRQDPFAHLRSTWRATLHWQTDLFQPRPELSSIPPPILAALPACSLSIQWPVGGHVRTSQRRQTRLRLEPRQRPSVDRRRPLPQADLQGTILEWPDHKDGLNRGSLCQFVSEPIRVRRGDPAFPNCKQYSPSPSCSGCSSCLPTDP